MVLYEEKVRTAVCAAVRDNACCESRRRRSEKKTSIDIVVKDEGFVSITGSEESCTIRLTGDIEDGCQYISALTTGGAGVQLTPDSFTKKGGAFITKQVNSGSDFALGFSVYLGNGTLNPADGFVFVISANSTSIGESGGGIGYTGIPNSIGIEYDTYNNGSYDNNINGVHTDFHTNGNTGSSTPYTKKLWDNSYNYTVYCWVEYDASEKTMEVRFAKDANRPENASMTITSLDVASIVGKKCYLGFTAATGGSNQQMVLKSLFYDSASDTPIDFAKDYSGTIIDDGDVPIPTTGDSFPVAATFTALLLAGAGIVLISRKKRVNQ